MKIKTRVSVVKGFVFISLIFATSLIANESKPEVNILFLGKSGAGKSTLINIFYNHLTGKKFEDERDVIVPLLHKRNRQYLVNVDRFKELNLQLSANGRPRTENTNKYSLETEHYVVNLWDTPAVSTFGYLDHKNDENISTALNGVKIHAVLVVIDEQDFPRDTVALQMLVNNVRCFIPDVNQENIFGVINESNFLVREHRWDIWDEYNDLFRGEKTKEKKRLHFITGFGFFAGDEAWDWVQDSITVREIVERAKQKQGFYILQCKEEKKWHSLFENEKNEIIGKIGFLESENKNLAAVLAGDYKENVRIFLKHRQAEALSQIGEMRLKLEQLGTHADPYIKYLSKMLRNIQEKVELSDREKTTQIDTIRKWIKSYRDLQIGVDHL